MRGFFLTFSAFFEWVNNLYLFLGFLGEAMITIRFISLYSIFALSLLAMDAHDEDKEEPMSTPCPPELPRNFRWSGRYIVPNLVDPRTGDIGINVPFTWHGNNGDVQMIAGSEEDPIYFTNLIYNDHLYTYTYKWPNLQPELLPPLEPCSALRKLSLQEFNNFLATSYFVGPEILQGHKDRFVNHFRVSIVEPLFPPGFYPRLPVALGDIYVDQNDSCKFLKVLHFGLQNIYAPGLDEWIVINKFQDCPGEIMLPPACSGLIF